MCQAVPARVTRVDGDRAWVQGRQASISLQAVEGVAVGDYIIYHAGLALERIDPDDAAAIVAAFRELETLNSAA